MADNKFFTNTYITGKGRQNYQTIKYIEDPLFTSFTFDIDFLTSPLFYTIYDYYDEQNLPEHLNDRIENALFHMHNTYMDGDKGYDILPVMTKSGDFGFGIQQNVYMDKPLYGATEYIYMVDKRNGTADQNDVRGGKSDGESYTNDDKFNKSMKLGDSVNSLVNDRDKAWAENQKEMNDKYAQECNNILNEESVVNEHKQNEIEEKNTKKTYENVKETVDGVQYNERELESKVEQLKKEIEEFNKLKGDIVKWANGEILKFKTSGTEIYNNNECVKKIFSYSDILFAGDEKIEQYNEELKKEFGEDFAKIKIFENETSYNKQFLDLCYKFGRLMMMGSLLEEAFVLFDGSNMYIKENKVISKFNNQLKKFNLTDKAGKIKLTVTSTPEWASEYGPYKCLGHFYDNFEDVNYGDMINDIMGAQCDLNNSFVEFEQGIISEKKSELGKFEAGLTNIQHTLYGGDGYDKNNPSPDSLYGKYIAAKEKLNNDAYSQAEKGKQMAENNSTKMLEMLQENDPNYEDNTNNNAVQTSTDGSNSTSYTTSNYVPQTVIDILGFISGMKMMTREYPYIIQGITGLDTAYNKHYGIKDPYLGSGDDKITLTCFESLDLRVSSMFNRYFNAIYDRQYRRERVPINLRRFNCSVYVHDVRNFNPNRNDGITKISELRDMYFSVIEFRFYDCEIVPEETGNIFNDISNEAPSEMKKTNFTFKYGNCVVNFLPAK